MSEGIFVHGEDANDVHDLRVAHKGKAMLR